MLPRLIHRYYTRLPERAPLRTVLTFALVAQTLGVVGLVGYLSYQSGQQTGEQLANQVMIEMGSRVVQHLDHYLLPPHQVNQLNADAITSGLLNLAELDSLERHFWKQLQVFNLSYIGFYANQETHVAVRQLGQTAEAYTISEEQSPRTNDLPQFYSLNFQGDRADRLSWSDDNVHSTTWLNEALARSQPGWSAIHPLTKSSKDLAITASLPLLDSEQQPIGVFFSDVQLSHLSQFLDQLNPSHLTQIFIVESNGLLVASSSKEPLYVVRDRGLQRFPASDSVNPSIRATAAFLTQQFNQVSAIEQEQTLSFKLGQQQQFVYVNPWQDDYGLTWLVVVTSSESAFLSQIQADRLKTAALCGVALLIAIAIATQTARWLSAPILKLNQAAKTLAQNDFSPIEIAPRTQELSELADSFNQMAQQLQASLSDLKQVNVALSESENRWRQLLEALPVGIVVHAADTSIMYLNQEAKRLLNPMLERSHSEQSLSALYSFYQANTDQRYPTEQLPVLQALAGNKAILNDAEIRRGDQVISLEAWATPIFNNSGQVSYALVALQDITQRKQAESVLADYNRILAQKVAEHTDALRRNEAQTQAILMAIPDLMFRVSGDGFYLGYVRTDQMLDLLPTNFNPVGLHISTYLPPEVAERQIYYIHQALTTQHVQQYEQQLWISGRCQYEEVRVVISGANEVLFMIRDITARKEMETAMQAQKQFLQQVMDSVPSAIFVKDKEGKFLAINQAGTAIYGCSMDEMVGNSDRDFNANFEQVEQFMAENRDVMETGQAKIFPDQLIQNTDGVVCWYQTIISPFIGVDGEIQGIIGNCIDITDRKKAEMALQDANLELERLASLDSLTQISNRRRFDGYMAQEWLRLAREQQWLSLILFDVDYFKAYNDFYGHQQGDECLFLIAQTAARVVGRPADLVARYGGEEFAVVLPNTQRRGAIAIAKKLQQAVLALQIEHQRSLVNDYVTISLGVASLIPSIIESPDMLIAHADLALYGAKQNGRNQLYVNLSTKPIG